tara:strand:+ start:1192 stop:2103 length:912 start_codon:yes stop_codon:yes gene_type:complete
MKKILLIGNQGSFLGEINKMLMKKFNVVVFPESAISIENENENILFHIYSSELCKLIEVQSNLEAIVFLGGEVRNKDLMMRENFHKPLLVANIALENKLQFLYLSSLSVYDGLDKTMAKVITNETKEAASSEYGRSKLEFDNKVASLRAKGLKSFTLRPASIAGSKRMNSSVERVANLAKRFPLLRYFRFDGIISYVSRSELSAFITDCLQDKLQSGVYLVANNIRVSCVIWAAVGKPLFFIPVDNFLRFLNWSFLPLRSSALKNLTNRLSYKSDHSVKSLKYKETILADVLSKVDKGFGVDE